MNRQAPNPDRRVFRAFVAAARAAIASDLAACVAPERLASTVQAEILGLLLARAGGQPPRPGIISGTLREELKARLREIELPYDFIGAAHLDYLSSTIVLSGNKPRIARNSSRKQSGSYYTPRSIVERVVSETLGRTLAEATAIREAARLRILDMACGSGVFLLEAARLLRRFYAEHDVGKEDAANIAAVQVFGADVSAEAVEVAKLAFQLEGLPEPRIFAADALHDGRFRWHDALPEVFEAGGFDVIVGNPPYGAVSRLDAETKRRLASAYGAYAGHGDLHYCFFERGLGLLKPGGLLGLLTSAYFMQASHAAKLRELLSKNSRIEAIIDCSDDDLFPDAAIHCAVTVLRKEQPLPGGALRFEPGAGPAFDFPQNQLSRAPWVIVSESERRWRAKIEKDAVPLGEICEIVQGPETGLNEAFVVTAEYAREMGLEQRLLRPLIKNSDIGRYAISCRDDLMIYIPRGTPIERCPAVTRHLEKYRRKLEAREVCRSNSAPWFALHRPRKATLMSAPRKIVCPYRAPGSRFAVDERRALNDGGDVRMIFPKAQSNIDLFFLVALLNSRTMQRYFSQIGRRKGMMLEYFKDSLKTLPMRIAPREHPVHSALAELAALQHREFSEQRDYLIERIILDLYELKASAAAPGMLF